MAFARIHNPGCVLFRVMKKKQKPVYPKCTECDVDLIPHSHLKPDRTLCVNDAERLGVDIERKIPCA